MVKKSHNAEKPKEKPSRLINRFLQTDNFKKIQGGTLWKSAKIFGKKSHSAEKKQRGTLWSTFNFWEH